MTSYEHLMLAVCFGAVMGWYVFSIGLIITELFRFTKKKIKSHHAKKYPVKEAKTDNE